MGCHVSHTGLHPVYVSVFARCQLYFCCDTATALLQQQARILCVCLCAQEAQLYGLLGLNTGTKTVIYDAQSC